MVRREWEERQRRLGSLREMDQEDRKHAHNLNVPVLPEWSGRGMKEGAEQGD